MTNSTSFDGVYEVPEAARYIHADIRLPDRHYTVRSSHVIRWIRRGLADPELVNVPGRQMLISFEDLISMRVIAFLRALGYSFHKIKTAEGNLRTFSNHPRPFATEQLWAQEKGALHIFAEMSHLLVAATKGGQSAFTDLVKVGLINAHGLTFDESHVADSWTPHSGILLHPRVQFGRPCLTGTRIPTADIAGMVEAGDKEDFLARSYGIKLEQIKAALEWETELKRVATS